MKGVVLAGGKATRLRPLTKVTNKHLLPIYDKPLIYYPLQAMARAGIRDVLVITNPEHAGHFIQLLGSGREFGLKLNYELQEEAGGLAQAVGLAETFVGRDRMLVLLGDNIFTHDLRPAVERFSTEEHGAVIFGVEMEHPEHYGVIEMAGEQVVGIGGLQDEIDRGAMPAHEDEVHPFREWRRAQGGGAAAAGAEGGRGRDGEG